jgi:hypothetical protein
MDATGTGTIQKYVASRLACRRRHDVLEIRAIRIATAAIPRARHRRVRYFKFRQVVHGAQAVQKETEVPYWWRLLRLCHSNTQDKQRQSDKSCYSRHV